MSFNQLIDLKNAVKSQDIVRVRQVLQKNPELLDHPDSIETGYELLSEAIDLDNDQLVEVLINSGADPNFFTPLDHAMAQGSEKCVEILLKNGARLTGLEWNTNSHTESSAVQAVFELYSLEGPNRHSRKKMLLLFLKYGLDIKFRTVDGYNMMHLLARHSENDRIDCEELCQILLDVGVPLDEPCHSEKGYTPLMYAIDMENLDFISFLIDKGANVNFKDKNEGIFPLYLAVDEELTYPAKLAVLLVSRGADINAVANNGRTALHEACSHEFLEDEVLINNLLLKGADINAEDSEGTLPFYYLIPDNYEENKNPYTKVFIKEYAKRVSFDSSFDSPVDEFFLAGCPELKIYYEICEQELIQMAKVKFYACYTYYDVLKMYKNINGLAHLTNNQEFVKSFERNLTFPRYKKDLCWIFQEAIKLRDEIQIVYNKLKFIFRDFFPDVVLRVLADHLRTKDLPID